MSDDDISKLPKLTKKQSKFLEEWFCNNMNGTEAWRSVYANPDTKTATCCVAASKLLKNPKIVLWVNYYKKSIAKHIESEIKYSVDDAFNECEELKIIALESKDKVGRPNVSAAIKAVETKIKLKGLLKEEAILNNSVIVKMGEVEIDGVPFDLEIGNSSDEIINSKNDE